MVTTRPDISFPIIKLSRFSYNPQAIHYDAVKKIFLYLKATSTDGIYYWRRTPMEDLPRGQLPKVKSDPYQFTSESSNKRT